MLSLASGMTDVPIVRTAPLFLGRTRKPRTHHQWSQCSGSWNQFLRSPACLVRFPGEAASAPPLAALAQILRTLSSSPNPQSKWYARSNAYPYLVCQFSDSDTTVLHDQSPHFLDDIVISASWGPTVTWFAVHWCGAIFEAAVPLFYSCDTHCIPKACWIFRIVSTWVSPSFWQNLMQ